MTARLCRRGLLGGMSAGLVLAASPVRASPDRLAFDVVRGGETIGSHVLTFRRDGDVLAVEVAIDLEVTLAWIPVFRYSHRNTELWRGGGLERLDSRTDDDGSVHEVAVRRQGGRLLVDGDDGRLELPGDTITTSYWHPATMERRGLLDTQHGRLAETENRFAGLERIEVAGRTVEARRYEVTGDLELTAWYGRDGCWSGLAFDARGEEVRYRPVQRLADESWDAIAGGMAA